MWNTRIFLIALLLVKVNARPDGYGVKGGRVHKATANAVASAHATAHADARSFGAAKSSASAIATASSNGNGVSDASAHADASIDGRNIEEGERREKENGNANELGDSDDLRESNDRGKATEYKSINHQDGTASWNPRNPDAEHVAFGADDVDSWKTEETHDEPDCSPKEIKGIKGHRGTSAGLAGSRCKNSQPGGGPQIPGQYKDIHVSADWQHSTEENGGKGSKSETIDRGHAASPCTPGDSKCHTPKPDFSKPQPSFETHPKLPDNSSRPSGIQNSYGQNGEKPESYTGGPCESPCANGAAKCPTHPGLPASSLEPPAIGNSHAQHGGIDGSHSASPCTPGDSKCFIQNPTVLSPHPIPQQHPDSPFGTSTPTESRKPGMIDRSYAGSPCGSGGSACFMPHIPTAPKTENSHSLCAPGDASCIEEKPSISKPHSTHGEKPDSSSGVHEGDNAKPGSQTASPCAGDPKCVPHKPTLSEHHSDDSQHSIEIGSQYGGQKQKPGTIAPTYSGNPCAAGDSKCLAHKPSVSYPSPSYENHPDSSSGSSSSGNTDHGYGGSAQEPGTIGGPGYRAPGPCAPLDWKCLSQEPIVPKPHSTYEKNPYLSAGSPRPMGSGNGNDGHTSERHGGSHHGNACSPGDWKCSAQKPSGPNSYPTSNTNPWTPTDEGHSSEKASGSKSDDGSQWSSGHQPGTSNPFFNGEIDVSSIKSSSSSDAHSPGQINHSNPFLNPNYQSHHPTSSNHPGSSNGNNGSPIAANQPHPQTGSSSNSEYPHVKPNPTNPFFHSNGQVNPTSGVKHPGTQTTPTDKFPSSQAHPAAPTSDCHGSATCKPVKPSDLSPTPPEHPHIQSPPEAGHYETKPSSPNPFFPSSSHGDKPKDSKYPEINDHKIPHSQTEVNQPLKPINDCYGISSCFMTPPPPKNPFFTNHGPESGPHGASEGHKPTQHPEPHGSSTLKPETGASVPNPFLGHNKDSSSDRERETAHGKGSGRSSHDCNTHHGPSDKDVNKSPVTEGFEMDRKQNNYGVKGHRPGVKGGSRGPPMRLQGSLGLGGSELSGPGHNLAAESSALASAGAFSQASASSSSSSAGGQSSASAKSEAYSRIQSDDGLSGSWAASHAHASAFASSYSSSDPSHEHGGSTIPEVSVQ